MKPLLLFVALLLCACGKPNDVAVLQREAVTLAKYYQPKLDTLAQRIDKIFKRGETIPATLPGIQEVGARLSDARNTLQGLRGIVSPAPDGKSALEKQAEALAKERKIGDLRKLIFDTQTTLERGVTSINDSLTAVEDWILRYERVASAGNIVAPEPEIGAAPTGPAAPATEPAPAPAPAPAPRR